MLCKVSPDGIEEPQREKSPVQTCPRQCLQILRFAQSDVEVFTKGKEPVYIFTWTSAYFRLPIFS